MKEYNIGDKFGRLTIVDKLPKSEVICVCECGKEIKVKIYSLKSGNTKTCGCSRKELRNKHFITHGLSRHPLFPVWYQMVSRCTNINHPDYKNYGGRGVTVSEEWLNNPEKYISDVEKYLGERPGKNYSIDRIDNNKGYSISNIKWSTRTEQNINRRSKNSSSDMRNIRITSSGKYRAKVNREKTERTSKVSSNIDDIRKIRDLWTEEYNKDREKYIKDTKLGVYKKSIGK